MITFKRKKYLVIGFIVMALPFVSITNYPSNVHTHKDSVTVKNPYHGEFAKACDAYIQQLMRNTGTPGVAVAVVKDGEIIYQSGHGIKKLDSPDSVDTSTVFKIASLSKGFAAVLAGMMVQSHKLHWDDRILQHVPAFVLNKKAHTEALSVKHVLSHTTGLPMHSYTNLIERGRTLDDMLYQLRNVRLISQPGEIYSYQNVAYSVIGKAMECINEQPYEQMIAQYIFEPLQMCHASSTYEDFIASDNIATPHLPTWKGMRPIEISKTYYNASPAGGINASISDMANWLAFLMDEDTGLLSSEIKQELFAPQVKTPLKNRYFRKWDGLEGSHYGLGWRILEYEDDKIVYHGGYVNGYRNEIAFSEKDNIGVCVLTNAPTRFAAKSVPEIIDLCRDYADRIDYWDNINVTEFVSPDALVVMQ